MKANVGGWDRIARAVIGVGLIGYASLVEYNWVILVAGLVLGATALIRFCGLYTLLGVSTCPLEAPDKTSSPS